VDDVHYLGPAILVAPVVTRGAREKTFELPEGRWVDWRDGTVHEGGGEVTLDAPLTEMPLLLRGGCVVPLLAPTIDTLAPEEHPGVVGPGDVADVHDVVGVLSMDTGEAIFELADGGTLSARLDGPPGDPSLPEAADAAELSTCDACWLREDLPGGVTRLRLTHDGAPLSAGGLHLEADTPRRIRWDLYLL